MALIIEDGSGVNPAANSYQTAADLRSYAELRGVNLSQYSNVTLEQLLIKAMDFLEAQRDKFKGEKTDYSQPLEWPRFDVWDVEQVGLMLSSTEIPRLIQYAQLALAIEAINNDLMPNRNIEGQGAVTKEKIGDIEVTYSSAKPVHDFTSAFSKPAGLLSPLFKRNGLRVVKV
jgi:hypothetical protein